MPKRVKYTKEILEPIVASSLSFAEVLRKLGIMHSGGMHTHLKNRIVEFGIDITHFLGLRVGPKHKGVSIRSWQEILILLDPLGYKEGSSVLRRAMIESGVKYECSKCNLPPVWCGEPLTLQVEHKNGLSYDNRPNNLVFLCPNCHTQTPTYGVPKQILNGEMQYARTCSKCGKRISYTNTSGICWECGRGKNYLNKAAKAAKVEVAKRANRSKAKLDRPAARKVVRPTAEELNKLVWSVPTTTIAKNLGVSDTAVAKWCRRYGIKKPPPGYWTKLKSQ